MLDRLYFRCLSAGFISVLSISSTLFAPAQVQAASEGRKAGLARAHDPLHLQSSVALVADADTLEVLFAKNPHISLPIASITKLMTVVTTLRAGLNLNETITITKADYDHYKGTWSRLRAGDQFSRRDLMHLALMASENTAAAALGRTFPGGMDAMVHAMNHLAADIGMFDTRFVETTGLSFQNKSTANDLAMLVIHAAKYPLVQSYSTSKGHSVVANAGRLKFNNTNSLMWANNWDILVQKTGFINEAGRCLVMQAKVGGRNLVIILLDAVEKRARFRDAERIRTHFLAAR